MGAAAGAAKAAAKGLKFLVKLVQKIIAGLAATVVVAIADTLVIAIILVRFIIMTALKSTLTVIEFAGETTLNVVAFVRDTAFSVMTFIVQTVTSVVLFALNQIVSVWRVFVSLISIGLGGTCFLAKNLSKRIIDLGKDMALILKAFAKGFKGLTPAVKAQVGDLKGSNGFKPIVKQSIGQVKDILMYIVKGDGGFLDGIVPSFLTELFQVLPMSFDLAKVILQGTVQVSKETISASLSILKELVTMKDIMTICKS